MRLGSWTFVVALMSTTAGGLALAGEKNGVTMPDTVQVEGKTLTLNGMGVREATFLNVDVYVAGLYLEQPSSDPAQILASPGVKRVVLHFVRDVDKGKITDAFKESYEKNATVPLDKIKPQLDQLQSWMRDFKDGDVLTLTILPGKGVEVVAGNQRMGLVPGDDFARSTLAVWLGAKPPNKSLKKDLLGAH
jgi:hypothetical protein